MSARFKIKIARHETANRFKLRDAERPAFVGQYPTLDRAMLAIDNTIRRERGMPERLAISPDEIRAAMARRLERVQAGRVDHAAPVRPIAPHSEACACTSDRAALAAIDDV